MNAIPSWQDLLASVSTVQQVVALANEYIARLDAADVALLPERCKPRVLSTAVDLNAYAIDLKMWRCKDVREAEVTGRVSIFFQEAASRLAQLTGPHRALVQPVWEERETARERD